MKLLNYDEIQKAIEDTDRDAFDYFLDLTAGEVIILSEDIIERVRQILGRSYDDDMAEFDDVEPDVIPDIPEWMEDEIELALEIFMYEQDRYVRIPERAPQQAYAAMKEFAESVDDEEVRRVLIDALDGPGSFRSFKDKLNPYPKLKKLWHAFNSKAVRKEIDAWLETMPSGN